MANQKAMLEESFQFMLNFFVTKKSSEYLVRIAKIHSKSEMDITSTLYDLWLNSLIEAVQEFDRKFDSDIELAWRIVLSPGITFMKFHHT